MRAPGWYGCIIGELFPCLEGLSRPTISGADWSPCRSSSRPRSAACRMTRRCIMGLPITSSGVIAGPLAGRYIAKAIGTSANGDVDVAAPLANLPPRFPLAGLRRPALAMVYLGYGIKEWIGDRREGCFQKNGASHVLLFERRWRATPDEGLTLGGASTIFCAQIGQAQSFITCQTFSQRGEGTCFSALRNPRRCPSLPSRRSERVQARPCH